MTKRFPFCFHRPEGIGRFCRPAGNARARPAENVARTGSSDVVPFFYGRNIALLGKRVFFPWKGSKASAPCGRFAIGLVPSGPKDPASIGVASGMRLRDLCAPRLSGEVSARSCRKAACALRVPIAVARVAPTERAVVLRVTFAAAQVALAAKGGTRRGNVGHVRGHATRRAAARSDTALVGKYLERRAHGRRCGVGQCRDQHLWGALDRVGGILWCMLPVVVVGSGNLSFHILFCLFRARVGLCPHTSGLCPHPCTRARSARATVAPPLLVFFGSHVLPSLCVSSGLFFFPLLSPLSLSPPWSVAVPYHSCRPVRAHSHDAASTGSEAATR